MSVETYDLAEDEKIGECEHCGDDGVVFIDNNRCQECDGQFIHCSICNEEQHRDDPCRHIFQDENLEWHGSGSGSWPIDIRKPFLDLVRLMPSGFAPDLREAILSGRFYTWLMAPLIGSGGCLELSGMPDRDGRFMEFSWGDAMIGVGEGEQAEETSDGYHWLASLYKDKTPDANRITVAWLEQFLSAQTGRQIRGGLHAK